MTMGVLGIFPFASLLILTSGKLLVHTWMYVYIGPLVPGCAQIDIMTCALFMWTFTVNMWLSYDSVAIMV